MGAFAGIQQQSSNLLFTEVAKPSVIFCQLETFSFFKWVPVNHIPRYGLSQHVPETGRNTVNSGICADLAMYPGSVLSLFR